MKIKHIGLTLALLATYAVTLSSMACAEGGDTFYNLKRGKAHGFNREMKAQTK